MGVNMHMEKKFSCSVFYFGQSHKKSDIVSVHPQISVNHSGMNLLPLSLKLNKNTDEQRYTIESKLTQLGFEDASLTS